MVSNAILKNVTMLYFTVLLISLVFHCRHFLSLQCCLPYMLINLDILIVVV